MNEPTNKPTDKPTDNTLPPAPPEKEIPAQASAADMFAHLGEDCNANNAPVNIAKTETQSGLDYVIPKKIHKEHADLLAKGVHPRDIPHIGYGYMRGCQCIACKEKRGEMLVKNGAAVVSNSVAPDIDDLFKKIFTPKATGIIADTPRRLSEYFFTNKIDDARMEKIWQRPDDEQKIIEDISKIIFDQYLNIPDFEHKALVGFLSFEALMISIRAGQSISYLKSKGISIRGAKK